MAESRQPEIRGRPRLANGHPDADLSPSLDEHRALWAHRAFVSDEALLDVSFTAARAGLTAPQIRGGLPGSAPAQARGDGITGLARALLSPGTVFAGRCRGPRKGAALLLRLAGC